MKDWFLIVGALIGGISMIISGWNDMMLLRISSIVFFTFGLAEMIVCNMLHNRLTEEDDASSEESAQ